MKGSTVAAATVLAVALLAFQSQPTAKDDSQKEIAMRGCVVPGEEKGTFVMTRVEEIPAPGNHAMPEWAHGRRVVYWLKNIKDLRGHAGHMVEVRGRLDSFKKSEIELKAGRQKSGDLYVEFEGPGKDVKTSNAEVAATVGTAGRAVPEKDEIPTFLAIVNVKNVTIERTTCQIDGGL